MIALNPKEEEKEGNEDEDEDERKFEILKESAVDASNEDEENHAFICWRHIQPVMVNEIAPGVECGVRWQS